MFERITAPEQAIERTIQYSYSMIRSAALRGAWRRIGWRMLLAVVLVLYGLIPAVQRGERGWWVGVGGTILVFGVLFIIGVIVQHMMHSLNRFKALGDGRAQISLTEEMFRFASLAGAVEYPWVRLKYLEKHQTYWFIGMSSRECFVLSLSGLGPEAETFIESHAGKSGLTRR